MKVAQIQCVPGRKVVSGKIFPVFPGAFFLFCTFGLILALTLFVSCASNVSSVRYELTVRYENGTEKTISGRDADSIRSAASEAGIELELEESDGWMYRCLTASVKENGSNLSSFVFRAPYEWTRVSAGETEGKEWTVSFENDSEGETGFQAVAEETSVGLLAGVAGGMTVVFAGFLAIVFRIRRKTNG